MTAGTVRLGGISVFVGIALAVIFPFVMVAFVGIQGMQGMQAGAGGMGPALNGAKIMSMVVNVIMVAIMVFVFFTTKGYFNALSYRRANISIYIIIGVLIVWVVLGLIMNTTGGFAGLVQAGNMRALGVFGIVMVVTVLVFFVALLIFAIFCLGFGNIGGGIWKAIGILYLLALIGFFVSVVVLGTSMGMAVGADLRAVPSGVAVGATVLVLIALLCYAAAIICHGIGLVLGGGRIERLPNPADAF